MSSFKSSRIKPSRSQLELTELAELSGAESGLKAIISEAVKTKPKVPVGKPLTTLSSLKNLELVSPRDSASLKSIETELQKEIPTARAIPRTRGRTTQRTRQTPVTSERELQRELQKTDLIVGQATRTTQKTKQRTLLREAQLFRTRQLQRTKGRFGFGIPTRLKPKGKKGLFFFDLELPKGKGIKKGKKKRSFEEELRYEPSFTALALELPAKRIKRKDLFREINNIENAIRLRRRIILE